MSRRDFLASCSLAVASAIILPNERAFATANTLFSADRSLSFYNLHTDEELAITYWRNGRYKSAALADINYLLRDFRTGDIKKIDTKLLDLLYVLHNKVGATEPFQIISGYRSPKTNAMLARRSRGVAKHSQHILGKAVDIRLSECGLDCLHKAAVELRAGGVGYYPASDFIHVDVGRVRYW
ncbi:MAG: DUF882 domain-containing protein [Deltaproteobacteria bacterium]